MLVLSRKKDEQIVIDGRISVRVIEIRGKTVRLGIEAPQEMTVHRSEVLEAILNEGPGKRLVAERGAPEDISAPA